MFTCGLFDLLKSFNDLIAIVGGRVFAVVLPENATLPAMTYQVVGGSSEPTFDTSGLQKVRVQFDFFADSKTGSYKAAAGARDALRKLLNGYTGTLSDGTVVQNADLIQNIDFFEEYPRQFRCMSEFYFYFTFNA